MFDAHAICSQTTTWHISLTGVNYCCGNKNEDSKFVYRPYADRRG